MFDFFKRRLRAIFHRICLLLLLSLSPAYGVVDVYEFEDEARRQRYLEFIEELRCPKCQNQNLAGSDSPIAADLRRELRRLLAEGRTDQEIVEFMVSRYGDYVLYRPKVQANTLLLWLLPSVLLVIGGLALVLIIRHRTPVAAGAAQLPAEEQQRLASLLDRAAKRQGSDRDNEHSGK